MILQASLLQAYHSTSTGYPYPLCSKCEDLIFVICCEKVAKAHSCVVVHQAKGMSLLRQDRNEGLKVLQGVTFVSYLD